MNHSPLGGVTLVYPYFRYKDPVEKLFPPLGIAVPCEPAERTGDPGNR